MRLGIPPLSLGCLPPTIVMDVRRISVRNGVRLHIDPPDDLPLCVIVCNAPHLTFWSNAHRDSVRVAINANLVELNPIVPLRRWSLRPSSKVLGKRFSRLSGRAHKLLVSGDR